MTPILQRGVNYIIPELKGIDAALAAMGDRAKRPKVVAP